MILQVNRHILLNAIMSLHCNCNYQNMRQHTCICGYTNCNNAGGHILGIVSQQENYTLLLTTLGIFV